MMQREESIGCVVSISWKKHGNRINRNQIDGKRTYGLNLGPALSANVQFVNLKLLHAQSAAVYTRLSLSLSLSLFLCGTVCVCVCVCLCVCVCVATASVTGTIRRRRNAFASSPPVHKNSRTVRASHQTPHSVFVVAASGVRLSAAAYNEWQPSSAVTRRPFSHAVTLRPMCAHVV